MKESRKRIYWFKLVHGFFGKDKMLRLAKSKGFDLDSLTPEEKVMVSRLAMECLYLKLLDTACTHEGKLLYDDSTPYDDVGLSEVLDAPEAFMKATLDRLTELRLFERKPDGMINLIEFDNLINSETRDAERKRGDTGGKNPQGAESFRPAAEKVQHGRKVSATGGKSPTRAENLPRDRDRDRDRDRVTVRDTVTGETPQPPLEGGVERKELTEEEKQMLDDGRIKTFKDQIKYLIVRYVRAEYRDEFEKFFLERMDCQRWRDSKNQIIKQIGSHFHGHYNDWLEKYHPECRDDERDRMVTADDRRDAQGVHCDD